MKYMTVWWGVALIPETEFEQHDLKSIYEKITQPENRLGIYEDGEVRWHTEDQLDFQGNISTTPLGALVMSR